MVCCRYHRYGSCTAESQGSACLKDHIHPDREWADVAAAQHELGKIAVCGKQLTLISSNLTSQVCLGHQPWEMLSTEPVDGVDRSEQRRNVS